MKTSADHMDHSASIALNFAVSYNTEHLLLLDIWKLQFWLRWIATSVLLGLSSDEVSSTHICFSGTEIQYFLCHEVWIRVSMTCSFSWMISSLGMVLLFVVLAKLSHPSQFLVPVWVLPGRARAMAPLRSCFLLCYPFSAALPGTWKQ